MPPLKEQEPLNKLLPEVLGDSGTERYGGYFSEEPNKDWRDDKRITNVETMRRTDATVKQLLVGLKAPVLSTDWRIEPASEEKKDVEIAEFVELNLFNMRRTWKDFLRELLTYWDFGFVVFEQVWQLKQGKVFLVDMEPRIQASIENWKLRDGRRGVTQILETDETDKTMPEIPMNKLLVLTNDKEGDDLTGQSLLRPAWKHFFIKDKLYRISAISCERFGVGIPLITLPEGAGDEEMTKGREMAEELRSNEKSAIVLPNEKWKAEILVPNGNPQQAQIDNLISHHDRMILVAGLAGFMSLGSDSVGSFALSKDQSSFFLKHVEDKAEYIAEQIGKQVIERLVILNYGEQKWYPRLRYAPLGDIDFAEFSIMLSTLKSAGLLHVDSAFMQFVHSTFKLPEIPEEALLEIDAKEIEKEIEELEPEEEPEAD